MPPTHQRFKDFKVLRISFGLGLCKLSELSALSVPGSLDPYIAGSLAPWLPGCLAPYWIYGSLVPGRPGPREAGKDHAGTSGSQDLAPRSGPRIWVLAEPAGQNLGSSGTGRVPWDCFWPPWGQAAREPGSQRSIREPGSHGAREPAI